MVVVVGSPPYLRSCGISPIDANWKMRLRAPIVVRPVDHDVRADDGARADRDVRSDDRIRADLDVGGELARRDRPARWDGCVPCESTHSRRWASGVRSAAISSASAATSPSTFAAHRELADAAHDAQHLDFEHQLVARDDLAPEARVVDAGEEDAARRRSARVPAVRHARIAATCASASITSTPGITGIPREMALEERLVDRHVLEPAGRLARARTRQRGRPAASDSDAAGRGMISSNVHRTASRR